MIKGYTRDTNILSALIREETAVTEKAEQTLGVIPFRISDCLKVAPSHGFNSFQNTTTYFKLVINATVIAVGELLFGAYKKRASSALLAKVQTLLRRLSVYNLTVLSPDIWGEQKARLESRGITIQDNDLWIAAIAPEYDFTVITRDKHFNHIDGLRIERW